MSMTKKDFDAIARVFRMENLALDIALERGDISGCEFAARRAVVRNLTIGMAMNVLLPTNPRFDATRFYVACDSR
jgi:hypothetical protein